MRSPSAEVIAARSGHFVLSAKAVVAVRSGWTALGDHLTRQCRSTTARSTLPE